MGVSKKKMGGFLVTTLILGLLLISFFLTLFKCYSQKDKYNRKVRIISYIDYDKEVEFRIQKFYGLVNDFKKNGKLESFFSEKLKEKMMEEGFLDYNVNKVNKEIELMFEKDKYFNYKVILVYNNENQLKILIKNIQETRKNKN